MTNLLVLRSLWLLAAGCWLKAGPAEGQTPSGPARAVTGYALTSASSHDYLDPKDWRLLASNDDGHSWTQLDAQSNQRFGERSLRRVFAIANRSAFRTYRLVVVNPGIMALAELELIGPLAGVSNEEDLRAIITASRDHPLMGAAEDAFDRDLTTRWLDYGDGHGVSWIQCRYALQAEIWITNVSQLQIAAGRMSMSNPLGDAAPRILSALTAQAGKPLRTLTGYALTSAFDVANRDPRDWRLLGSNDGGKTWQTLDARRNESFANRLHRRVFMLAEPASFALYRLQIDSVRVPGDQYGGANSVQIAEIEPLCQRADPECRFSTVVSARGENPPMEVALAAFDGDASTKWLDFCEDANTNRASWIEWQYLEMAGEKLPVISRRWLQSDRVRSPPMKLGLEGVAATWNSNTEVLSFLDETGLQRLKLSGITKPIQPGERIRLGGQLLLGPEIPGVLQPELELLGLAATLTRERAGEPLPAGQSFFLSAFEGHAVSVSEDPLYVNIRLATGDGEILVHILNRQHGSAGFFPGCRLRACGVAQAVVQASGERRAGILWAPDLGHVSLAATTQKDWNEWPQRSLEFLRRTNSAVAVLGSPVRVAGTLIQQTPGRSLVLGKGTNEIVINSTGEVPLAPGSAVEAIGFLGREQSRPVLQMAQYRPGAESTPLADGKINGLTNAPGSLTTIREIYERIEQQPGKTFPVKVRGVITYLDLGLSIFYIQDGSYGIMGDEQLAAGLAPRMHQEGLLIELEGEVDPSRRLILVKSFAKVLGLGRMPEPQRRSWDALITGKDDGQWVQVEGAVSAAEGYRLTLMQAGGRVMVWVNQLDNAFKNRLLGSVVRVNGVCSTVRNRNRRVGVRLLVPSQEHIEIVAAAPEDPFDLPLRPISRVMQPDSGGLGQSVQLVRTAGVVTYQQNRLFFVQDGVEGLRVFPRTETPVEPGERVEVVGLAEPDGFSPKLVQAVVRKVGKAALPSATAIDLLNTDLSNQDATRGFIEAVCLGATTKESLHILDLQDCKTERRFSAFIPAMNQSPLPIPVGSRLRLAGVFKADTDVLPDFGQVLSSFQMYVNSPEDIVVLERPSWWTARRTLFGLGGLGAVLLLSLAWVGLLRRQVRQRTGELQDEITEHKHTEDALQTSELFMRSLVGSLPQNILRKDVEGRFTFVNEFFCHTHGKTVNEILGKTDLDLFPAELAAKFRRDDQQVMASGKPFETVEENRNSKGEKTLVQVIKTPLYDADGQLIGLQVIFWDVTEKKQAEARLEAAQKGLLDASRQAGMAEVATGVLHNVGNVLNSVNVSANLLTDNFKQSKVSSLARLAALVREHEANLGAFFTENPKGKQVPGYLSQLAEHLAGEQAAATKELHGLTQNIEHIKNIVAMQQSYAKHAGVTELVRVTDLVEDALRMNAGALARQQVQLAREFESQALEITVEKHKVLQILVNLIRNAKFACDESGQTNKRLTVRVGTSNGQARISVADNGVGIAPENLTRVFGHGFTTRKEGHGFGLHSGALAAKEMGGTLQVHSDGLGKGATFTLDLPLSQRG